MYVMQFSLQRDEVNNDLHRIILYSVATKVGVKIFWRKVQWEPLVPIVETECYATRGRDVIVGTHC
jgi:hypothetical protein